MTKAQLFTVLSRVGPVVRQGLWFLLVVGILSAGPSIGMAREQSVTVRTEEFRRATGGVEALINIPVVSGVGDASAEWQLNRDIRQEVLALAGAAAASAWQYRARSDPAPAKGRGQQRPDRVQVDYEVTHQSANLISLRVACYLDTGAGPSLIWLDGITVEIRTGKRLSLADLFSPAIDYRQVIGWMLSEQVDSDQRAFLEGARTQVWNFTESNFYIRGNDLVIFFQPGEIAPFSSGSPEFRIDAVSFGDTFYLNPDSQLTPIEAGGVRVEWRRIRRESKFSYVDYRYPVIYGLGNPIVQEQLNIGLEKRLTELALTVDDEIEMWWSDQEIDELIAAGRYNRQELRMDYRVEHLDERLLSFRVWGYEWPAGAGRDFAFVKGITLNVRTGQQVTLSDLFQPGVDYQSIIAKEIERQILMHPENYYPEAKDHASDFLEEYFYVSDGDIVMIFNLYELAGSYREFRIPAELFGDSLSEYLKGSS